MNLNFYPESSHVQLSSNLGMTLSYSLKLKPDSAAFSLKSGLSLSECIFDLTIHPLSQSPYADKHAADGRLGEFRPFMSPPSKEDNLYMLWLHIPDEQFNTLLFETSRQNLPIDIDIGVNDGYDDGEPDRLSEGVYNDVILGTGHLPLRFFLFTVKLSGS